MSEAIIVALITGGLALLGTYLANRKAAAIMEYRLEQLEKKVNLHNNVIERTYHLEEAVARIKDEDVRQNHRLDDLEREP